MIKFAIQLALFLVFLIFYRAQGARVQPTAAIALTPLLLLLEVCDELQLRSPVTGCLGPEPTHEETRVCLPQHPAVAYLFLVVSARCCYLS